MSIISNILNTRQRYRYRKKLPAFLLLLLLAWVPTDYSYAKEKKCAEDYREIMYNLISKRIKDVKFSRECDIVVDVNLPLGLIVGDIKYTNTASCRHVANIVEDISEYRMAECYDGHLTRDNLWTYVLIFGKKE